MSTVTCESAEILNVRAECFPTESREQNMRKKAVLGVYVSLALVLAIAASVQAAYDAAISVNLAYNGNTVLYWFSRNWAQAQVG